MTDVAHISGDAANKSDRRESDAAAQSAATDNPGSQWHRERLHRTLSRHPISGISPDEVQAHFECMPDRYWSRVNEAELAWGLQAVHRFLTQLTSSAESAATVVMDYRHCPQQSCTKVLVCTWDHLGLLTQLAGYLSALRLNVIKAEVYTRSDNIVLDVFWVTDADGGQVANAERLTHLNFLLEGGLSDPPRFASTWARESHKHLPKEPRLTPIVEFNNRACADHTILTIEASERLGLLHDMLEALTNTKVNVSEALIDTVGSVARDAFYISDEHKQKISDPVRLQAIRSALLEAAG